jgi:glyoxylase-like metal-dependent hydrolase (beta-lactamase superfamily II)
MEIGNYKLTSIETGRIGLDGGAMYGVVPKVLWERSNPADEKNRVELTTRQLVLQSDSKNILIDTGIGEYWDEKFTKIYKVDHTEFNLLPALESIDLKADDITDVILTHLHFDHTGGSTVLEGEKWRPAFPNAKYHVQKKHFDWAVNPSDKDRASFVNDRFVPLREEGILNLINDETEFDDNISFILIDGHTFSQQMVKISDGNETLLYCADLMPFHTHINIPYIMAYDLQPLKTLEEKKRILPIAAEENWKLFFEHDPDVAAITINNNNNSFTVNEVFNKI